MFLLSSCWWYCSCIMKTLLLTNLTWVKIWGVGNGQKRPNRNSELRWRKSIAVEKYPKARSALKQERRLSGSTIFPRVDHECSPPGSGNAQGVQWISLMDFFQRYNCSLKFFCANFLRMDSPLSWTWQAWCVRRSKIAPAITGSGKIPIQSVMARLLVKMMDFAP